MRLLVVSCEAGWAEALRALFPAPDNVIATDVGQLAHNRALAAAADACFVAEATTSPWTVETLKQISALADTPLFVLADAARSQWEEAVLFAGAQQIFRRPLRAAVIQLAISRCQRTRGADLPSFAPPPAAPSLPQSTAAESDNPLVLWRDFSRLLGRVGDGGRVVQDYLMQLRDVLHCGRAVLYVAEGTGAERTFRCACASGADPREWDGFRLSPRTGVVQWLLERGTVVNRARLRPESGRDAAAARELMVFGAEVAVPVSGPAGLAGVLLVGPRISGAEYTEHELTLLYHSVEGLAALLATLAGERRKAPPDTGQSTLLQALPLACALVRGSGRTLEANSAFRTLLGRNDAAALTFDDLPDTWSAPIAAAVQNRVESARVELDHRLIGAPKKLRLTVRRLDSADPMAADPVAGPAETTFLVQVEDAVAAAAPHDSDLHGIQNLLQRAGEQLSNEFRNALTPVDIMVQLARDASTSRVELERLSAQVGTAMHRLRRRVDDLAYLTKSAIIPESTTVSAILRFTRERLDDWLEDKHLKRIVWLNEFCEASLMADHRAVALALAELVINAVEASSGQQVTVTAEDTAEQVTFRVRNAGVWTPPPESSGFRHRPFVSSKSAGVGLGIEVATRVAENHGGRLLLGPISADTIEATMRLPRKVATPAKIETRVAQAL